MSKSLERIPKFWQLARGLKGWISPKADEGRTMIGAPIGFFLRNLPAFLFIAALAGAGLFRSRALAKGKIGGPDENVATALVRHSSANRIVPLSETSVLGSDNKLPSSGAIE
jgi:hypothetical protein